uniref:glycoside hydrolase family 3 protein n=1 Tax=Acetatifactor sp. TaxID=1872090 RepID=UPI004055B225
MSYKLDLEKYAQAARQAAAEGCVLLKNDNETLPLRKGDKVAVFGRCAFHYYKSGLGSGGLVNTRYVVSILDALKACEDISVEESLLHLYEEWSKENPIDEGHGWGTIPWSQAEMPVIDEVLEAAKDADVAVVIVGRTAGEDQDNSNEAGSYLLTDIERDMIAKVSKTFARTVVLLNVGNIIDMNWVEEYNPSAVMYVWQGGQEGGNGVVDVLTGKVNPCGKLTDTIAYSINDYPSTVNFGDKYKNYYTEDIYVGYRYFETFAKDKVQYPFGFGLSYTQFIISSAMKEVTEDMVRITAKVQNTGTVAGKEVVLVYVQAPQGVLGKPSRVLAGFAKTNLLQPGECAELTIECSKANFTSYDDAGVTGHKSCYILEPGVYRIYVGTDVRSAVLCGNWQQEEQVIEVLQEACAPIENFERLKPLEQNDGSFLQKTEKVPVRTVNLLERIETLREDAIPYTGDKGYVLGDVFDGKVSLDEFVAQLSDEDLMCIFRGEGMCSPKVTPGTAGAFGGLTERHRKFGIPAMCCADGPSGIRMDCGTKAFSIPNGTALGCSFNLDLVQELFGHMGRELRKNKVDTLLGPGINIHRNPLNGRNFEYISEDPLLTGKMGAVQLLGMHESGVTGTIKHFAANNQEKDRTTVEAAVSERALREIYLKGYEICVKEGNARSIMTSYNPINGIWAAGNFDLCTTILRKEWGYQGIVMTDWWANSNWDGEVAEKTNRAPMVRAQNDIYMCCASTEEEMSVDNVKEKLESGDITRYDLQRNSKNILKFIMESPAMLRELGRIEEEEIGEEGELGGGPVDMPYFGVDGETGVLIIEKEQVALVDGEINFGLSIPADGDYSITLEVQSELTELAQLPVSLYIDNLYRTTHSFRGTNGALTEAEIVKGEVKGKDHYVKLVQQGNGLEIRKIMIKKEV